jgi:hypothetical protein
VGTYFFNLDHVPVFRIASVEWMNADGALHAIGEFII